MVGALVSSMVSYSLRFLTLEQPLPLILTHFLSFKIIRYRSAAFFSHAKFLLDYSDPSPCNHVTVLVPAGHRSLLYPQKHLSLLTHEIG